MNKQELKQFLQDSKGVLRLTPTWVPRSFCRPGKRIKLHPDDYYALGAARGGIDERWFASTTHAENGPETPEDEGLSYIALNEDASEKILLKDAVELLGASREHRMSYANVAAAQQRHRIERGERPT